MDDLYEILGVAPDASDDELRRVWRQLARKWHPDSAGNDTTFIFQRLLATYETLADPAKRAAYDRKRPPAPVGPRAPGVMLTRVSGTELRPSTLLPGMTSPPRFLVGRA